MSSIIIDASITLAWCFPDEQTPRALGVLEQLKSGAQALVPHFWSLEILNSMLVAERQRRITSDQTRLFLELLDGLRPDVDYVSSGKINGPIQKLCRDYKLTPYDAVYVELAQRTKCALATLDEKQETAALALHIVCL